MIGQMCGVCFDDFRATNNGNFLQNVRRDNLDFSAVQSAEAIADVSEVERTLSDSNKGFLSSEEEAVFAWWECD